MNDPKKKEKRSSILVVDDEPKNIQLLVNILRKYNYKISVATDGRMALEKVDAVEPDLILLDVMMPELDGFQVCETLKKSDKTKDIPVIFLTAKTETDDIVKGFQAGAIDYVVKPFKQAELVARVNTHVRLREAEKEIRELEQKNTVMAMAVTANHEINQPLTVMQGNFELYRSTLNTEELTDKQKKYFKKIADSIEKISCILKKYIHFKSARLKEYTDDTELIAFDEH
ncbi:MAG: response regulator [bacterium]|nr:response regulator [bacterium]